MFRKITLFPALCALALSGVAAAQSATPPADSKPVARADVPMQARMAMHVSALVAENLKAVPPAVAAAADAGQTGIACA